MTGSTAILPGVSTAAPALERKRFSVDVPFAKAAQKGDGTLELVGYASTWILDRDREIVAPGAFDASLPDYLGKNPILLWQHNPDWPIGTVKSAEIDDTGLRVVAEVPKPEDGAAGWEWTAYGKIKAGVVRTFSIGGFMSYDVSGKLLIIKEVELFEISVVSIPANPDSIFEAAQKALRGEPTVRLSDKAQAQMAQLLGAEPLDDPDLAELDEAGRGERYEELALLYRAAALEPPEEGAWKAIEARLSDGEGPLDVADDVLAFVARVKGLEPVEKAGRVLSKANESKLAQAQGLLEEVLSAVREAPEGDPPPKGLNGRERPAGGVEEGS